MRNLLLSSAITLFSVQAHAAFTINSISGVSNYNIQASTTTTPGGTTTPSTGGGTASATVWGGFAGWDTAGNPGCATTDSANVCDSCQNADCKDSGGTSQTPLCACNRKRVYNSLKIGVSVSQSGSGYNVRAAAAAGTAGTTTDLQLDASSNTGVTFQWTEVCRVGLSSSDCETAATTGQTVVVAIYLDKDNSSTYTNGDEKVDVTFRFANPGKTDYNIFGQGASEGIGEFTPWPGDDRAYLKDVNTTTNFPTFSYGEKATSVKVYLSKDGIDKATPKDRSIEGSLEVDKDGGINQNYVDEGVTNGTTYYMRLALEDAAGNVVAMFPDLAATDAQTVPHPECISTTPANATCPFAVVPDAVLGILSKDFNCFVASAAYGSSLEPKLGLFRKFRNDVLFRYAWGRSFIWQYYAYGPYAARYISDKPVLRFMVRGLLWPLAGYSWLALQIGLVKSLIVSFSLITAMILLPWMAARRVSRRA